MKCFGIVLQKGKCVQMSRINISIWATAKILDIFVQ